MSTNNKKTDWFATEDDGAEDKHSDEFSDDEPHHMNSEISEESRTIRSKKRKYNDTLAGFLNQNNLDDSQNEEDDSEDEIDDNSDGIDDEDQVIDSNQVLKRLSTKELQSNKEKIEKSGVVYLSRIPPFMKPAKVRQVLGRFGEIDRVFLSPEDPKAYARRVRFGGNKKRSFVEGWIEFKEKKKAKLAASTLNGNIIGGKKGSYYHDDILNVKYLPKFKWHHLTEQISYENQSRQSKLRAEISQANRENKTFIRNVERAKMIEKIQGKRKKKQNHNVEADSQEPIDIRRNFKQRMVKDSVLPSNTVKPTDKGAEDKMKKLLSNIFA
ncbi:hypothetical protein V1514DRAFT_334470 [Lipomyces japonicus]|uniref:uncharacterized protein n=1 Tax=Lipomyces japonicus TaxID=56871 RepID=UPI0034CE079D